ncbi:unnamed protein product [Closterium sp. NIES-54]
MGGCEWWGSAGDRAKSPLIQTTLPPLPLFSYPRLLHLAFPPLYPLPSLRPQPHGAHGNASHVAACAFPTSPLLPSSTPPSSPSFPPLPLLSSTIPPLPLLPSSPPLLLTSFPMLEKKKNAFKKCQKKKAGKMIHSDQEPPASSASLLISSFPPFNSPSRPPSPTSPSPPPQCPWQCFPCPIRVSSSHASCIVPPSSHPNIVTIAAVTLAVTATAAAAAAAALAKGPLLVENAALFIGDDGM